MITYDLGKRAVERAERHGVILSWRMAQRIAWQQLRDRMFVESHL